jgi:hypothetical protein
MSLSEHQLSDILLVAKRGQVGHHPAFANVLAIG